MSKVVNTVIVVVVALILMVGSFYGGTLYGKQQAQADLPQAFRERMAQMGAGQVPGQGGQEGGNFQPGQGGFGRLGGQGGGLFGQIQAIDGDSLLVTGFDGQEVRVLLTDTTLIEKYASVTAVDLEPGEQVTVSGSENEDGSITARSVQVAPAGRFAPRGSGAGGS